LDLPPEIVAILAAFAPLFSDRVWVKAQLLAVGALLAPGDRTVCATLRVLGLSQERHFTNYHRVLNRDAWSCLAAGQVLLGLIVAVIPRDWPIVLAADDTIERRNGRRIKAKGCYRDPVRSSRKRNRSRPGTWDWAHGGRVPVSQVPSILGSRRDHADQLVFGTSVGAGSPLKWARTASSRNSKTEWPCCVQVAMTVQIRSSQR
jgi:DDE superfamily endonuclease